MATALVVLVEFEPPASDEEQPASDSGAEPGTDKDDAKRGNKPTCQIHVGSLSPIAILDTSLLRRHCSLFLPRVRARTYPLLTIATIYVGAAATCWATAHDSRRFELLASSAALGCS
jgi:hypothetical protein